MTALQERTAQDYQARVGGFFEVLTAGSTGIGFLLGSVIAIAASPRAVYLLAGLGILLVAAATVVAAPTPAGRRPLTLA